MGHYDHCYEAEERRRDEELGRKFKATINAMSDEQAGQVKAAINNVFSLAKRMNGTADQHRSLESYKKQIEGTLK